MRRRSRRRRCRPSCGCSACVTGAATRSPSSGRRPSSASKTANLTLPMLLGVALVWRYRDRAVIAPLAAAAVVALKLFLLAAARLVRRVAPLPERRARRGGDGRPRPRAVGRDRLRWTTGLYGAALAGIGFAGLRDDPGRLSTLSRVEGAHSYSLAALLHSILSSWTAAVAVAAVVGVAMVVLACVAGRRGRERDAFALVLLAVLVLTPLLERDTPIRRPVLLVLVALYRPRLSLAWAAPCLIWGAPGSESRSRRSRRRTSSRRGRSYGLSRVHGLGAALSRICVNGRVSKA